jgi:hypothetical protein
MSAEPSPNTPSVPAKTPVGSVGQGALPLVSRVLLGIAGLGLLAGFFMPWLRFGDMVVLSGFSLSASSGDAVEVISGRGRALLFMVPISALALMACAYTGHRISIWVALLSSAVLLAYGAFTIVRLFLASTGVGMWIVVGCALLAFAIGLIGYGRRTHA